MEGTPSKKPCVVYHLLFAILDLLDYTWKSIHNDESKNDRMEGLRRMNEEEEQEKQTEEEFIMQ